MAKITLDTIKKTCEKVGWTCISPTYSNLKELMYFRCDEGHLVESPWGRLRDKFSCPVCKEALKQKIQKVEHRNKTDAFRVIGLDQSTHKTGYSIYDDKELIAHGVFTAVEGEPFDRIASLCDWLTSLITLWKPDLIGIEDIQYNPKRVSGFSEEGNHNTFKLLGQTMGAIIITSLRGKVPIKTVLIPTWRGHCGVRGNTRPDQKRSAQLLVKKWHDVSVTDDESDAICIGKYFADTNSKVLKQGIGEY